MGVVNGSNFIIPTRTTNTPGTSTGTLFVSENLTAKSYFAITNSPTFLWF